jgi:hypothetical protein
LELCVQIWLEGIVVAFRCLLRCKLGLESCSKEGRQYSVACEKLRRERASDGDKLVVRWLVLGAISLVETTFSVRFPVGRMPVRSGELADLAVHKKIWAASETEWPEDEMAPTGKPIGNPGGAACRVALVTTGAVVNCWIVSLRSSLETGACGPSVALGSVLLRSRLVSLRLLPLVLPGEVPTPIA